MLAIYAKPPFLRVDPKTGAHVVRISSRSRGEEISSYLKCKYNEPRKEGDICIHVKPRNFKGIKDGDYIDILDNMDILPGIKLNEKLNVIAMSEVQYEYLKQEIKNKVVLIHHHHINLEGERNTKQTKLTGGIIGHSAHALGLYNRIREALEGVDIDFIPILSYTTRQDSIDFFKKIDFLVAWNTEEYKNCIYSHPTKLINAASFGIPTLSQPIDGYKEFEGYYIPITDMESLVEEAVKFKDEKYYSFWSDRVFDEAKKYHISKIAKLYEQLV